MDDHKLLGFRPAGGGAWDIGGVHFHVTYRPNWFQRWMVEIMFGWKWVG
jgi:hypothetical protein